MVASRSISRSAAVGLLASLFIVLAVLTSGSTAAAAPSPGASARAAKLDRRLIVVAKQLGRCQQRGVKARCAAIELRLQRAARSASGGHRASVRAADARPGQRAPTLRVSDTELRWHAIADVDDYVLVRKVPRQRFRYSVVSGTSFSPPVSPGKRVTFSIRTLVDGSRWARERSVAFSKDAVTDPRQDDDTGPQLGDELSTAPARRPKTATDPGTAPAEAATPQPIAVVPSAAPSGPPAAAATPTDRVILHLDGTRLRWTPAPGVQDFVLVAKTPSGDRYSQVHGTAVTPSAVPGATVSYSVRSDVAGASWANQVSITWPAAAPSPAGTGQLETGVVAGSALTWELPFIQTLRASSARMEFDINTPITEMAPAIEAYARAGVRPLLLAAFNGRLPTQIEAAKLGVWAATFGPGGSFWNGKGLPTTVAPTHIEFGNESSYAWQYAELNGPDWATSSFYANLARQYGLTFKTAALAIKTANAQVDLLAVGDAPGNWPQWLDNIYDSVPEFGDYVGGWTVHPYGPNWQQRMDSVIEQTHSHGASDAVPLYVTEVGVASDDGRCLDDNYGWSPCQTYDQAAVALTGAIDGMSTRYGARLGGVWLYQAHDQRSHGATGGREHYFGGLTYEGQAKGALTTTYRRILASGRPG